MTKGSITVYNKVLLVLTNPHRNNNNNNKLILYCPPALSDIYSILQLNVLVLSTSHSLSQLSSPFFQQAAVFQGKVMTIF